MASHRAGIFAVLLFGTSTVVYGNVHEMREWSMVVLFAILLWIIYWRLAHKQTTLKIFELIPLFLVIITGLYVSYMVVFVLASIGLYHLVGLPKNKNWWQITLVVLIAGLFFAPWIPIFLDGIANTQDRIINEHRLLMTNIELLPVIIIHWGNGLMPLFAGVVGLGLFASWRNWRQGRNIVFFFIVILASFLIANQMLLFVKHVRYVLLWIIPFALLGGFGLASVLRWKLLPYIFLGLWIICGYQFALTDDYNFYMAKDRVVRYPEYNGLIPLLRDHTERRELLVVAQYENSAMNKSKQGMMSIHDYYMKPLKLTITQFPQYSGWSEADVDADQVEYALGLVPGYNEFWLTYHYTRITDHIIRFQEQVSQDFEICHLYKYGERSVLIHYVAYNDEVKCENSFMALTKIFNVRS